MCQHHAFYLVLTGLLLDLSQTHVVDATALQAVKVHNPAATLSLTVPVGEHA